MIVELFAAPVKRERPVRTIKAPSQPVSELDLALEFGDSSDDSDFHIEDHKERSDESVISDDDDDARKLKTLKSKFFIIFFV